MHRSKALRGSPSLRLEPKLESWTVQFLSRRAAFRHKDSKAPAGRQERLATEAFNPCDASDVQMGRAVSPETNQKREMSLGQRYLSFFGSDVAKQR